MNPTYESFASLNVEDIPLQFLLKKDVHTLTKLVSPFDVIRLNFFIESFLSTNPSLRKEYFIDPVLSSHVKKNYADYTFSSEVFMFPASLANNSSFASIPLVDCDIFYIDFLMKGLDLIMQQLSYLNLRVVSSDAGFEQASVIPSAQDLPTSSTLYLQRKTSDDNFHSMSIAETCQLLQEMDSLLSQVPTIFLTPICTSTLQACLYLTASVLETQLMKASMARNLDSVEVSASLSSTMSATTISPTEKVPGRTQPLTRTIIDNLWRQISTVEAIRILPSGEDFMVPYEIAIQANPSRNEMNFLDLSDCPVQHQVILASYFHVRSAGAAIRHAAASLLTTLSHESTHFVQAYVDQLDLSSSPTAAFAAWSAEFDASILSYSIYLHLLQYQSQPPPCFERTSSGGDENADVTLSTSFSSSVSSPQVETAIELHEISTIKQNMLSTSKSIMNSNAFAFGLHSLYFSSCLRFCADFVEYEKVKYLEITEEKQAAESLLQTKSWKNGSPTYPISVLVDYVLLRKHRGLYTPKSPETNEHIFKELIGLEFTPLSNNFQNQCRNCQNSQKSVGERSRSNCSNSNTICLLPQGTFTLADLVQFTFMSHPVLETADEIGKRAFEISHTLHETFVSPDIVFSQYCLKK